MKASELIKNQRLIGNTPDGRHIGDRVMPMLDRLLEAGLTAETDLKECDNCFLILDSESFKSGCPNCGSKAHHPFSQSTHGREVVKERA